MSATIAMPAALFLPGTVYLSSLSPAQSIFLLLPQRSLSFFSCLAQSCTIYLILSQHSPSWQPAEAAAACRVLLKEVCVSTWLFLLLMARTWMPSLASANLLEWGLYCTSTIGYLFWTHKDMVSREKPLSHVCCMHAGSITLQELQISMHDVGLDVSPQVRICPP